MWIKREISKNIRSNRDPIQILRGPRQCGKTSLFLHLDPSFKEVSFDDPSLREFARADPQAFLKQFEGQRLFIDEAQYVPEIFSLLKRQVDLLKRSSKVADTLIRLTGSNQILMDRRVKESLAGRAAFFDLNTLSIREIHNAVRTPIASILFKGGWPELYKDPQKNPKKFLDDYIASYVEKDIVLAAGIQKQHEFLRFIHLLAGRVGQIIDYASFGNDCGVDSKTAKDWLSILERMHVVFLLPPFYSNLSKRLIKSPKVYFIDTGLVCRLQGWTQQEPILTSPQMGALFENLVFSEIYKLKINHLLDWKLFHWRSRDGEEVDFVVEYQPNQYLMIESKVSYQRPSEISNFPEIKKVFAQKTPTYFQCHMEGEQILDRNVPIRLLSDHLEAITNLS